MVDTIRKGIRRAVVLSGMLVVAACGGDAFAPAPQIAAPAAADAGLVGDLLGGVGNTVGKLLQVKVLERKQEVKSAIVVKKTIGRAGGIIEIPQTGMRFVIPPGALDKDVAISVTAIKGKQVAYEFAPHGLTFKVPTVFQQNLSYTNALLGLDLGLQGGYFKDVSQLDPRKGTALVDEIIRALSIGGWVSFPVDHFSGYLVSCA
ncbi:MAG: hypothetical protein ACT4P7_00820 [Gemmatimonadaceae bacterium]